MNIKEDQVLELLQLLNITTEPEEKCDLLEKLDYIVSWNYGGWK